MRLAEFQSTRPRGARRCQAGEEDGLEGVSIHAPAGGATLVGLREHDAHVVSIHAPAGGATPLGPTTALTSTRFNPRARGGRDTGHLGGDFELGAFQSTRPRGARLQMFEDRQGAVRVSIHAPAGGATRRRRPSFNPRARGGRDFYIT